MLHKKFKVVIYLLASLAVMFVFLSNWSLLDGMPRNSFAKFLDGTAHKPFVYRLLLPQVVSHTEPLLPDAVRDMLANNIAPVLQAKFANRFIDKFKYDEPGLRARANKDWSQLSYRSSYVLAVILLYASLLATLFVLSRIAAVVGASTPVTIWAPVIYIFVLPLTYLNGGYYYDIPEQFFVSLLLLAALTCNWTVFVLAALLGQLNKETMLLMPLILTPLFFKKPGWTRTLLIAGAVSVICFLIYMATKAAFAANPGMTMEYNLGNNLTFWAIPMSYIRTADIYAIGLPIPRSSFLLVLIAILFYAKRAPRSIQLSAGLAMLVFFPLYLAYGFFDEFRSMGTAFPLLYLIAIGSMQGKQTTAAQT
jgi:hypothetical protein